MATRKRTLGQAAPVAQTLTDTYTVGAGSAAVISSISIANRAGSATAFRLAISPGGAAIQNKHYFAFDTLIYSNETILFTLGATLEGGDVVRVQNDIANLSFNIWGEESTQS